MYQSSCDVLIIGMGLGAVAIARHLTEAGASVKMLPGAGCARFKHFDGGIVNPTVFENVLGATDSAPIHTIGKYSVFQRDELEAWAVSTIADSVSIVEDFEEARTHPHDSGRITVVDSSRQKSIIASSVVLTEGANPKIGIAARVREDFIPEDMIHFGRTRMTDVSVSEPITGSWRTSWGMPAWYSVIPQPNGALVSASVRIENVMRANRDGRAVLKDLLEGPHATELGIGGKSEGIGMELVPLKANRKTGMIGAHNLMITFDANGSIDARSLDRYNLILASGSEYGAMMAKEWPNLVEWDEMGVHAWDMFSEPPTPYHDDSNTGFIEDGPAPRRGLLRRLIKR